jgi:hypothetical protein
MVAQSVVYWCLELSGILQLVSSEHTLCMFVVLEPVDSLYCHYHLMVRVGRVGVPDFAEMVTGLEGHWYYHLHLQTVR